MQKQRLCGIAECFTFRCLGGCLVFYAVFFVTIVGMLFSGPYLAQLSLHPSQSSDQVVGSKNLPARSAKDNSPQAKPKVPIPPLPGVTPEKKPSGITDRNAQKLAPPKQTQPQAAQATAGATRAATKAQPKAAPMSANKVAGGETLKPDDANITDFTAVHNDSFYLYAAHHNSVKQPAVVTIVAIVDIRTAVAVRTLVCVYYSADGDPGTNVSARLIILPDHHHLKFATAFIHCSLPDSVTLTPLTTVSVAVTSDKRGKRYDIVKGPGTKSLPVQLPAPRKYNFLVCFSPLHHNFGAVTQVVANLELAQALGAQHAVVYNTSITRQLDAVLRHYVSKGFLEVLGWRGVPEPVHYKAQSGAINDCLLRNRQRSDFIVYMDTDEMIVPRVHPSWADMLRALQAAGTSSSDFVLSGGMGKWGFVEMTKDFENRVLEGASKPDLVPQHQVAADSSTQLMPSSTNWTVLDREVPANSFNIGAVSFVSSVFLWDKVSNLTAEELRFAQRFHLAYLLKQRRTVQLWPLRSKTIVNPRTVDTMGIHRVSFFADERYTTLLVKETVGLLQHYRWYDPKAVSVKDTNVLRFASTLVRRMSSVFKELGI